MPDRQQSQTEQDDGDVIIPYQWATERSALWMVVGTLLVATVLVVANVV